ncbi:MAG: hypothetical protein ACRD7E_15445 [Bryobacteraceae bacterium]
MGGYLAGYGAGAERREKTVRWLILAALALVILGIVLYFQFRDYSEEQLVKEFIRHLANAEYKEAYALWGCSESNPCPQYPFENFMDDWGPKSPHSNAAAAQLGQTKSCETGIVQFVDFPGQENVQLWVDRNMDVIGFAPWPLRQLPDDFTNRLRGLMWEITRNCDPLIRQ